MAEYEKVFASEFNNMMNMRRAKNSNFSLADIPYPDLGLIDKDSYVAGGTMSVIRGILEPYFDKLNGKVVELIKGRSFPKRIAVVKENGKVEFRKDSNGSYITRDIDLETGFVAVYSSENLHIPNKVENRGITRNYTPANGYSYIDYVDTPMGRKYLYTVPMEVVYPLELCALVIAFNKHKAYYKGCRLALTTGHFVHIYSIPYKYRENSGYVLIGAKPNPNFDKEFDEIIDYWTKNTIIFDLKSTELDSQYKGDMNVAYQVLPGTVDAMDYKPYSKPLKSVDEVEFGMEGAVGNG